MWWRWLEIIHIISSLSAEFHLRRSSLPFACERQHSNPFHELTSNWIRPLSWLRISPPSRIHFSFPFRSVHVVFNMIQLVKYSIASDCDLSLRMNESPSAEGERNCTESYVFRKKKKHDLPEQRRMMTALECRTCSSSSKRREGEKL